jgi:hypothetical protein
MASSYSTDLKLELMVTGENSGTWGDKTNSNLNLLQQAIAGYQAIALTSINTTLVMTNATISDARNAVIKFTGTIAANTTVFVDSGIEKTYIIENGTSGAFTLALNQVGGNSVIFGAADKTSKIVYLDGTNANDLGVVNLTAPQTLTNKTLTSPVINEIDDNAGNELVIFSKTTSAVNEFTITNSITGTAPEISATGGDTNIDIKITPKGTGKVNIDGIKYPNTDGSAGQLLSTDGSGNLSFITVSSEAQFIAGSIPLAATKSTTARTAVSISKATGEVGAYPVLNVYSSTTKTVTTTATVNYSLDGSYGIIQGEPNASTRSLIGVYTPSNGTPVIGNTSVLISVLGADPGQQAYGFGINLYRVASDIFLCSADAGSLANPNWQAGSRFFTARVNTSGAISIGNITSVSDGNVGGGGRVGVVQQMNVTTCVTGTGGGVTTNSKVLTLDTNLTTINRLSTNQSSVTFHYGGVYYNYGNIGDTYYFPTNSSVIFSTLNATTRLLSVPVTQSIATNFYLSTATWYKVSNTRWLADYQNATTLAREIATFNVNATTLAFSSINSTSRLYSGMVRFLGTTADVVDISTNLTTAVLDYAAGLGFNVNTLELSTNGEIKGYNVGTALGLAGIDPYDYNTDPNTSNQIVTAFLNTSSQYKNLIINAASTDQFNYAGIATANDSTSPTTVIQNGIQDGYTGLLIGSTYYVNFDGTLTAVATNITAGVAVTSTQLQVRQVNI